MVKNMVALRPAAVAVALCCFAATVVVAVADVHQSMTDDTNVLMDTVDRLFEVVDNYELTPGVRVRRAAPQEWADSPIPSAADRVSDPEKYLFDKVARYVGTHILDINFVEMFRSAGRAFISLPRLNFGKNSFLTGFGLGFLAFGLKKLLLPVIIGAQIIKSIALAALLPTILGSVGKIVSKGVTNFAAGSSHFNPNGADGLNDFEFKDQPQNYGLGYDTAVAADTSGSETGYQNIWTYPPDNSMNAITTGYSNSRYPVKYGQNTGISNTKIQSGNYYTKDKTEDFKVFQTIPTSSHLLANYDPFYSPLLSRIDTVFKQLGYTTEPCRERLVCQMYKNPAKFAPYSNLVSAQLSRELNELRKPSSENPEILRFFKYMKAAKDGQDNQQCEIMFSSCMSQRSPDDSVPMMTTYNEINKLVLARNAKKIKDSPAVDDAKSESPAIDVAKSESPAVDVAKSESPAVDVTKSESPAIDVVKSESLAVDVAKSESSAIDVAKSESSAVVIADKVSEPNSK